MKQAITLIVFGFFGCLKSQSKSSRPTPVATVILFGYDASGNQTQRYQDFSDEDPGEEALQRILSPDEEAKIFWSGIELYPIPVKDVLTISWNDKNDELINTVTIFEHNTLTNLFSKQNIPNLNRKVEINMSSYRMGVYILSFQLKNGKTISRNIIKN